MENNSTKTPQKGYTPPIREKRPESRITGRASSVKGTVTPSSVEESHYETIRQGILTNSLVQADFASPEAHIDELTGQRSIQRDNLIYTFSGKDSKGLSLSALQLLDIFAWLWEKGRIPQDGSFSISVQEYMDLRGLKDRKSAKECLKSDIKALMETTVEIMGESKKTRGFSLIGQASFIDSWIFDRNGLHVNLGRATLEQFRKNTFMPYHLGMLKINSSKYPNAYKLGRKLQEYAYLNLRNGEGWPQRISVENLLKSTSLPSLETVRASGRHFDQQIFSPLDRDLECLEKFGLSWRYAERGAGGAAVDGEILAEMSPEEKMQLLIEYTFSEFPVVKVKEVKETEEEQKKKTRKRKKSNKV